MYANSRLDRKASDLLTEWTLFKVKNTHLTGFLVETSWIYQTLINIFDPHHVFICPFEQTMKVMFAALIWLSRIWNNLFIRFIYFLKVVRWFQKKSVYQPVVLSAKLYRGKVRGKRRGICTLPITDCWGHFELSSNSLLSFVVRQGNHLDRYYIHLIMVNVARQFSCQLYTAKFVFS